jgi:hypothetical protein
MMMTDECICNNPEAWGLTCPVHHVVCRATVPRGNNRAERPTPARKLESEQPKIRFIAKIEEAQRHLRAAALAADAEAPYNAAHDVLSAIRALRKAVRILLPREPRP